MAKIHIAVLGRETLPIYYLIMATKPDKVYIISTDGNKDETKRMKNVLKKEKIKLEILTVQPYDSSIIQICEQLHQKELSSDDEITYNITGGTKPMCIGAYTVAIKYHAEILYTNSDTVIDMRTFETKPLDTTVDTKTIFELQGQTLRSYDVYQNEPNKIKCVYAIAKFISTEKNVYRDLRHLYNQDRLGVSYNDGNVQFELKNGHLTIIKRNQVLLDISSSEALSLLFDGRWWEIFVADEVYQWAKGRFAVWQNVVFESKKDEDKDKNEIDVLVNTGNKLLIIECKSGKVIMDNINKMSSIRKVYGSEKSKSVLMPFWPVRKDLYEKIRENNLSLIKPGENVGERLDKILASQRA